MPIAFRRAAVWRSKIMIICRNALIKESVYVKTSGSSPRFDRCGAIGSAHGLFVSACLVGSVCVCCVAGCLECQHLKKPPAASLAKDVPFFPNVRSLWSVNGCRWVEDKFVWAFFVKDQAEVKDIGYCCQPFGGRSGPLLWVLNLTL